jgi:hypothetical protein
VLVRYLNEQELYQWLMTRLLAALLGHEVDDKSRVRPGRSACGGSQRSCQPALSGSLCPTGCALLPPDSAIPITGPIGARAIPLGSHVADAVLLPGQNNLDGTGVGRPCEDVVRLVHVVEGKMMGAELTGIDLARSDQTKQRGR